MDGMDEDGWGEEGALDALLELEPPTFSPFGLYTDELRENFLWETAYKSSGGIQWSNEALLYYRDRLDDTEKDDFLKVPASDLDYLCTDHDPSWLRDMLKDAVVFFKLHRTWQVYICPSSNCLRWFSEGDSLVLHLMNEHCHAWPCLRQNPTPTLTEEQWCAKALCRTAWKPIDVSAALTTLSTISLDGNSADSPLDADHLASFEWPLSHDFRRIQLLANLQSRFLAFFNSREKDSFSFCSNGVLRDLISVASEEVLRHLDPTNILPTSFRALMYCSHLSFRFMEADPLDSFLGTVEWMCDTFEHQASQSRESEAEGSQQKDGDVYWRQDELFDAVSFPAGSDYFVLDAAKLQSCGIDEQYMGTWLFDAPIFPSINKLPTKASVVFKLLEGKAASFSNCLMQSDLKLASATFKPTSCLKMLITGYWPISLLGKLSPEISSNSESNAANVNAMPSAKGQKTNVGYQMMQHCIELIKLTCEVQYFEVQLRRLCAVDLRAHIMPLLKSYLRMKLYLFMRFGCCTGDVKEEDPDEGNVKRGSREEHPEELVHSEVKEEPVAEDGSDVMIPDPSLYKRSEELSTAPPELVSGGSRAIAFSDLDPMMIDGGEALGEEPPCASAGEIDSRGLQVGCADATSSRIRTGIALAIAESKSKPEALPESDAESEFKAETEFQWSRGPLWEELDMYSDSELPESKGESENRGQEMEEFFDAVWFMREQRAWETKEDGLFICISINDVVKHCLENTRLAATAQNIWELKANRSLQYWRCCICDCDKRFPDKRSHMLHMESEHNLGLFWEPGLFVPSQVWQVVNEGVKEMTHYLDDSVTMDCTYRTFLVEIAKLGSPLQNGKECQVRNSHECQAIVEIIQRQLFYLDSILDMKNIQGWELDMIDAVDNRIRSYPELNMLKQNLSELCFFENKNEILHSIKSYLKEQNLMGSGLRLWTLQRLKNLLLSIRWRWHPDSFSINLTSPGKVVINMEEHNDVIGFAYIGICWEFTGDMSCEGSRDIKGSFTFSGASTPDGGIHFDRKVILAEGSKMTMKAFHFRNALWMDLPLDVVDKLCQFQADFIWVLHRLRKRESL